MVLKSCIERLKMNLSFLRSGEIQEDNVLPRYHLVSIFKELTSNLGELCDCVVDLIP